jgi:hypothetical protein
MKCLEDKVNLAIEQEKSQYLSFELEHELKHEPELARKKSSAFVSDTLFLIQFLRIEYLALILSLHILDTEFSESGLV